MKSLIVLLIASLLVDMSLINAQKDIDTGIFAIKESRVFPGGKYVSVNLPLLFTLSIDAPRNNSALKLETAILKTFIQVSLDIKKTGVNQSKGPITIKIAGFTIYNRVK